MVDLACPMLCHITAIHSFIDWIQCGETLRKCHHHANIREFKVRKSVPKYCFPVFIHSFISHHFDCTIWPNFWGGLPPFLLRALCNLPPILTPRAEKNKLFSFRWWTAPVRFCSRGDTVRCVSWAPAAAWSAATQWPPSRRTRPLK